MTVVKIKFNRNFKFDGFIVEEEVPQGAQSSEVVKSIVEAIETSEPGEQANFNPQCPTCNSNMKLSKSGRSWICINAKWKKTDDGEFVNSGCQGYIKV